ncbi:DUF5691 domain-containing protein [Methylobacterium sp. J-026]|uniref:DUF5691 domain-containing protein n=1 Tax=Methylobacterium sp. J-026 TaxID=2836624 RepID=UPI001FBB379C|nr:DUF5691 domain-containing protein [Methylobacterium sp. J-026]MCJ2137011.1 DUF5691 domain-containing protein [Methylobacterium sp. J-026]
MDAVSPGSTAVAEAWDRTLAAALLGADRTGAHGTGDDRVVFDPSADAGATLLARLAAHGIHHLAGSGFAPDALVPVTVRPPAGAECPPAAASRLALLLTKGDRARVAEWCDLAGKAGLRAPAWLLPALAARRGDLPEAVARVAGAELAWLDRACAGAGEPEATPTAPDWTLGAPADRQAAFRSLRAGDAAAARAALAAGFTAEKAGLRARFVAALAVGLSEADGPFLETCLNDRAAEVRAEAQYLLPRLPGSAFAARMAARAREALRIEAKRRLLGTAYTLVVTLPEEDPALARDGIAPRAHAGQGSGIRAGLLREVLAASPLHALAEHPPRRWIELALRTDWSREICAGLLTAARRAGEPAWSEALATVLGEACAGRLPGVAPSEALRADWAAAAALLPATDWERLVEGLIRADATANVLVHLGQGPSRFSEPFTRVLLGWLAALIGRGTVPDPPWQLGRLIDGLAERAWPSRDAAAAAGALRDRFPQNGDRHLAGALARLAETLELRAAMRRDFAPDPTVPETAPR